MKNNSEIESQIRDHFWKWVRPVSDVNHLSDDWVQFDIDDYARTQIGKFVCALKNATEIARFVFKDANEFTLLFRLRSGTSLLSRMKTLRRLVDFDLFTAEHLKVHFKEPDQEMIQWKKEASIGDETLRADPYHHYVAIELPIELLPNAVCWGVSKHSSLIDFQTYCETFLLDLRHKTIIHMVHVECLMVASDETGIISGLTSRFSHLMEP